ncbi:hypothetical protein, partial [Myxococcus llanfairpwllgwyngyllgogerychwyrndrobwllllantysiliogogogochensis]|uniref:hypothetical protein n=1 Tax=Myxococcus llanfairpwllgwyngyllgogerychwyrndrobwllllantysiliogogogochensis TaxID=2590453 RepID=UPI0015F0A4B8
GDLYKRQERGWSVVLVEEEGEAAAPEADVEDGFLEGLALVAGEGAMSTEGAIHDALSGGAGEHEGDGLG